jgi:hypothetical protein
MKLRGCEPLPSARAAHGPPRGRPAGSASPRLLRQLVRRQTLGSPWPGALLSISYVTHVRVDTPSALRASSRCGRVKPLWAACVGRRRSRHHILTVPYLSSLSRVSPLPAWTQCRGSKASWYLLTTEG